MVDIGGPAPLFTLPGTDGTPEGRRDYALADYAGAPVVLVFYPADHSPVCTLQLSTYSGDIARFQQVGAQVLAISPQTVRDHEAFSAANGGFGFPLLSDLDKKVAEAYEVLGPVGFYRRSVFVVDAAGRIRYAHRATAGLTFRSTDELIDVVSALPA